MPSTKYEGLSYPTNILKSRGSVIRKRKKILNADLNKPHFVRDEMIFFSMFASNKAKHLLYRHFCATVVTQFIVKVNEKWEKVPCLKVYRLSIRQIFRM